MTAKKKPRRGRPPKPDTFDTDVRTRLFSRHKELLQRAADHAAERRGGSGDLSSWMRETLIKTAREELGEDASAE
jgi:hypothetical protein